jgi:hypothetical protein
MTDDRDLSATSDAQDLREIPPENAVDGTEDRPAEPSIDAADGEELTEESAAVPAWRDHRIWAVCAIAAASAVAIGTFLPWFTLGLGNRTFHTNGWDLTYSHSPRFQIAVIDMFCAAAGATIGALALVRARALRHVLVPAMLVVGLAAASLLDFAGGTLRSQYASAGYTRESIGLGLWLVLLGAALMVVSGVVSVGARSPQVRRGIQLAILAGVVEFALLLTSIGGVVPLLLLVGGVAAVAWGIPRLFPPPELAEAEHAKAEGGEETESEGLATAGAEPRPDEQPGPRPKPEP